MEKGQREQRGRMLRMRSRNSARLRLASPQRVAAHFIPLSSLGRPTTPVAGSLRPSRATTKPPTLTPGSMSQCICSRKQRPRSTFETPPRKAVPRFYPTFPRVRRITESSPLFFRHSSVSHIFCQKKERERERERRTLASTLDPMSKLSLRFLPLCEKRTRNARG